MLANRVSKFMIAGSYAVLSIYFTRFAINYFLQPELERKFIVEITLPFDAKKSPLFEIISFLLLFLASVILNVSALTEGLLVYMVSNFSIYF